MKSEVKLIEGHSGKKNDIKIKLRNMDNEDISRMSNQIKNFNQILYSRRCRN